VQQQHHQQQQQQQQQPRRLHRAARSRHTNVRDSARCALAAVACICSSSCCAAFTPPLQYTTRCKLRLPLTQV
jgi:hypothetical protein